MTQTVPEQQDTREQIARITALWRAALATPPHPPGCSCMGGFAIPPPSPADLEEDILLYLKGRYDAEGVDDLAALVEDRNAAQARGALGPWLGSPLVTGLADHSRTRLLADLETVLTSYRDEASQARSTGFVCY